MAKQGDSSGTGGGSSPEDHELGARGAAVEQLDEHLNRSLDDVIELLEREIERLKLSLDNYRLSAHPNRAEIVRWHVRALDERQDALEDLKAMILSERDGKALH